MKAAEVMLVKFPFSDKTTSKQRPALVLRASKQSNRVSLITIAMISSRVEKPHFNGDVILNDWKESGLLHPSLVRLDKIATLDESLMIRQLGYLSSDDTKNVRKKFKLLFDSWF